MNRFRCGLGPFAFLLACCALLCGSAIAMAPLPAGKPGGGTGTTNDSDCEGQLVEVVAEGLGNTPDDARKNALRAAVSQVVGMLVVGVDREQNDAVIESKVLT